MSELALFPDNTVLINFAVIGRLDLLVTYLAGRGRMTQAVRAEVRKSVDRVPHLREFDLAQHCGEPILLDTEADILGVALMRKRFARRDDPPTKHLGESETLHVMQVRPEFALSRFLTEDGDAYRVAGSLNLLRHNTMEIFQTLVGRGELTSDTAFELMADLERSEFDRALLARPSRPQDLVQ